ncbi:MAG: hypothetical protein KI792_06740 [Alphaproteobacteria bacterium]|nr:hypothetical protein [Alphaproteobacteria bacterium SS10]
MSYSLSYDLRPRILASLVTVLLVTGCSAASTDAEGIDQVLPYWSAPQPSSDSVLRAAREFDLSAQPAPNLASVPARPNVSAAERIAALDAELSADLTRADELRESGDRPDLPPPSEIDGLEGFQVDPAPAAPDLVDAPAIDLSAPAVQLTRPEPKPTSIDPDTGLPPRTGAVPEPPPLIEAPPEPDLAELPTPEPVPVHPPEFGVEDIEPAPIAPPPAAPVAIAAPPPLDIAEPPSLELPSTGGVDLSRGADADLATASRTPVAPIPSISERAEPLLVLSLDGTEVLGSDAQASLEAWAGDTAQLPNRLRLVPFSGADVAADDALGRARTVSQALQQQGIARERLILAPPVTAPDPAAAGQVAIFAAP